MYMKRVSLIIPTYNQNERLKIVLEVLKNQNYDKSKFEVIVIDDGSTDETESIVKNINSNYRLLYKKHKNNLGRAKARNSGAEIASGDILLFLDSDRVPVKNFINEHLRFQVDGKKIVVIGNPLELFVSDVENKIDELIKEFRDDEQKLLKKCRYFNYADCVINIYDRNGRTKSGLAWLSLFSGNFSIKRTYFDEIGGFDDNFRSWGFENFDLGYRLMANKFEFCYNNNAVNVHLYHNSNRKSPASNENYNYFCNKYGAKDIKNLAAFLEGTISLQELESYCNGYDKTLANEKPIIFISSKFGKRYEKLEAGTR